MDPQDTAQQYSWTLHKIKTTKYLIGIKSLKLIETHFFISHTQPQLLQELFITHLTFRFSLVNFYYAEVACLFFQRNIRILKLFLQWWKLSVLVSASLTSDHSHLILTWILFSLPFKSSQSYAPLILKEIDYRRTKPLLVD